MCVEIEDRFIAYDDCYIHLRIVKFIYLIYKIFCNVVNFKKH